MLSVESERERLVSLIRHPDPDKVLEEVGRMISEDRIDSEDSINYFRDNISNGNFDASIWRLCLGIAHCSSMSTAISDGETYDIEMAKSSIGSGISQSSSAKKSPRIWKSGQYKFSLTRKLSPITSPCDIGEFFNYMKGKKSDIYNKAFTKIWTYTMNRSISLDDLQIVLKSYEIHDIKNTYDQLYWFSSGAYSKYGWVIVFNPIDDLRGLVRIVSTEDARHYEN